MIAGWCEGREAISFALEYGAHAGMGIQEVQGFTLLPMDAPLDIEDHKEYLRPTDLRHTAQHFLNQRTVAGAGLPPEDSKTLTLMSYNVHGCAGMDGCISTDRIARVIARYRPDIIALQELDIGRKRSGKIDQVDMIAKKLEMKYHFHPAFRLEGEQYGNAILSRYPMSLVKSGALPGLTGASRQYEPRGALWVSVDFDGKKVQVINTHLSLWPRERSLQVDALLSPEWLRHPDCQGPVILCGDFNSMPRSNAYSKICDKLYDSQLVLAGHRPRSTWSGQYPLSRIDYVFIDTHFQVHSITVPRTNLEKIASDHLPLIAGLNFVNSPMKVEKSQ